ncbi:MAG: phenylalanine--tRNA ligase subunit beta [Candidatus Hydrogenedentota bacterium]|nr:MAG: phenylalanine--tRNA ligase subunit beta [Candidatus Hydrogenedentota bacterium]
MKILKSWLEEYLPPKSGRRDWPSLLSRLGIEVVEEVLFDGGEDRVWELEITANRPDLLCHRGVAREVAALLDEQTRSGRLPRGLSAGEAGSFPITIESDSCAVYCGWEMEGVKVGPTDPFFARRLEAVGLRPISNVVDATNYLLMDRNHPLHAFDRDRLVGGRIIVRRARRGETLLLLDGRTVELTEEDLVIADAEKPVALAGIMGGEESAVTESTTAVLLEAAWFDPSVVRRTARRLGLSTDSSYRFERGADPEAPERVIGELAALLAEWSEGRPVGGPVIVRRREFEPVRIRFRPGRAREVLGCDISEETAVLERIGCRMEEEAEGQRVYSPPLFRWDLKREIDLIEELARFHGYDRIPVEVLGQAPPTPDFIDGLDGDETRAASRFRELRLGLEGLLRAQGFDRCCTFSFEEPRFGEIEIRDPLNREMNVMRSTLIPALCRVARTVLDKASLRRIALFEVEKVFRKDEEGRPEEAFSLAVLVGGILEEARYDGRGEEPATRDHLLGVVREIGRFARIELSFAEAEDGAETVLENPRRILAGGTPVGWAGEAPLETVAPPHAGALPAGARIFGLEWDLNALFSASDFGGRPIRYRPLPRFPASVRDLAFVVSVAEPVGRVIETARKAAGPFLESISLFDVFPLSNEEKSVAIRLIFRSAERTLTEEEVHAALGKAARAVTETLGARLRGNIEL